MGFLAKTPIRIPLSTIATPKFTLLDMSTGEIPDFFAGTDVAVQVCVFGNQNFIVNISTATAIECDIIDNPTNGNVLAFSTCTAASIRPVVQYYDWQTGVDQQAVLVFPKSTLLNIPMVDYQGFPVSSRKLWMAFHASLNDGSNIQLGTGAMYLRSGVPDTVQLPLYPPPELIPTGTTYTVPPGITVTFPSSPTVLGDLILSPSNGILPAGSMVIQQP